MFATRVIDLAEFSILLMHGGTISLLATDVSSSGLRDRLHEIFQQLKGGLNLIVVDGVVSATAVACWEWFGGRKMPTILCTSRSFSPLAKCGESHVSHFLFCSWRLEDYLAAVSHKAFLDLVQAMGYFSVPADTTAADAVSTKYFYAGGSARLMFHKTIEEIMVFGSALLGQIGKGSGGNSDPNRGDQHAAAVNTLMQRVRVSSVSESNSIIVSKYFALQLQEHAFNHLVQQLVNCECSNPSVMGFVYEAQCICTFMEK